MRKLLFLITVAVLSSCASATRQTKVVQAPPLPKKKVEVVPEFKAKPIYIPPEVVRVLIYPYEDEKGILHQGEFLYFTVRDGYWTIASKSGVMKADKMVHIVRTQKGLDVWTSAEVQPKGIKILKPENKENESKLKEIESYVKE